MIDLMVATVVMMIMMAMMDDDDGHAVACFRDCCGLLSGSTIDRTKQRCWDFMAIHTISAAAMVLMTRALIMVI